MDKIISHQRNLRCVEFNLKGTTGIIRIRFAKKNFPVIKMETQKKEAVRINYDDIKIGSTNVCGVFTIFAEQIAGNYVSLLDSENITIEPPKPVPTYHECGNIVGSNYTSSSSCNQIEFWDRFEELVPEIKGELKAASGIGINSLRVFLHEYVFTRSPQKMLERMDIFTSLCAEQKIKPLYVFFDDCWYGDKERVLDFRPIPGSHNGRWAKCPLLADRKYENFLNFEKYIKKIISGFRNDERIFGWDIWNEPKNNGLGLTTWVDTEFTQDLMLNAFLWARQVNPVQPLVSCWEGDIYGDINNQHNYAGSGVWENQTGVGAAVDINRGTIITEAGCRTWKSAGYGSPVHWISVLEERRKNGLPNPGVYLNWELMAGNSNCTWHWSSKAGDKKPGIPWCGFFFNDLTPVSVAETSALRRYTGLPDKSIILEGFDTSQSFNISELKRAGHFTIFNDGRLGELRHTGKKTERLVFNKAIQKNNWDAQVFIRLDSAGAMGGIALTAKNDIFSVLFQKDGLAYKTPETSISISKEISIGEQHNVKISASKKDIIKIYLDDLKEPCIEVGLTIKTSGKISLIASGNLAFDDFAVVYS